MAYVFEVDKENSVYKVDIAKIINVDTNNIVKMCQPKAQFSCQPHPLSWQTIKIVRVNTKWSKYYKGEFFE